MGVSTLGGIFLIMGAIALWRGNFLWATAIFFVADCVWVVLAYRSGDVFGTFATIIGTILGALVWLKSKKGIFVKDLETHKV